MYRSSALVDRSTIACGGCPATQYRIWKEFSGRVTVARWSFGLVWFQDEACVVWQAIEFIHSRGFTHRDLKSMCVVAGCGHCQQIVVVVAGMCCMINHLAELKLLVSNTACHIMPLESSGLPYRFRHEQESQNKGKPEKQ